MSYRTATSESSEDTTLSLENAYCIFLHIAEGVGLQRSRNNGDCHHDQITMHASLNSVKFEIEGHSTETVTIFNSNCIWECSLNDLKRMKTENRPVRITCFLNNGTVCVPPLKLIGTLLLPIRGIPTVTTLQNYQPKLLWHKLGALCADWRPYKPEVYLLIVVAKKSLIEDNSFNTILGKKKLSHLRSPHTSETSSMLQSQSNVYVQLLEQLGLIQVGNNPDVDCDIFLVMLTLKRIKDLAKLLEIESADLQNKFVFQYELFGSATHDEITTDASDNYTLNQKIALKFKTSPHSLRLYFQRIFYIPIIIYYNGHAIATYRFDCSKFFPDVNYFNSNKSWNKNGSFYFDRLHKILSPRSTKPSMEFTFSVQVLERYSRKFSKEIVPLVDTFVPYNNVDKGAAGDGKIGYQTARNSEAKNAGMTSKRYNRANSEPEMRYTSGCTIVMEYQEQEKPPVESSSIYTDTEDLVPVYADTCVGTNESGAESKTVGVNTEPIKAEVESRPPSETDPEMLTVKMVEELEAWKAQQMDQFLEKLERKEVIYLRNLEKDYQKQYAALQHSVELERIECKQLKQQLESAKMELETRKLDGVLAAKREAERRYAQKIEMLEKDIQSWKEKLQKQQRTSAEEKQSLDAHQKEKAKLQHENYTLKKTIGQLEQKIVSLGKTHFSADQLKEMMSDLRQQTARFSDVEKQRNYFKEKLMHATRELQQLKMKMLKQQELTLLRNSKVQEEDNLDVSLGENITLQSAFKLKEVEKTQIESDAIKEMILLHSESSSSYEDAELEKTLF